MSAHNMQFHDKIRKNLSICVFMSYRKNFVGTQKRVRISHGKPAIGVQAIEVRLYCEKRREIAPLSSFSSLPKEQFLLSSIILFNIPLTSGVKLRTLL